MKRCLFGLIVLLVAQHCHLFLKQARAQNVGTIITIAGGGHPPFREGAPARETIMEGASSVAFDDKGNLYVTAFLANRVFKIDSSGSVSLFAGNGERQTSGDGGPARQAGVNGPNGVAVDGNTVFIAEQLGDRIRRVDEKGTITTVAGTGKREPPADGIAAREASLSEPAGLAVHKGGLYFTEFAGNLIRKIDADGTIHTIAGTGERASNGDGGPATRAAFKGPVGIVIDEKGDIYVTEVFGARVRRFSEGGTVTTLVGLGPSSRGVTDGANARDVHVRWPHGIAVDKRGDLYFSDFAANRIYEVNPQNKIRTIAGTGSSTAVDTPLGLALDPSGRLYVALYNQGALVRLDRDRKMVHIAGQSQPAVEREAIKATDAYIRNVGGVSADRNGNVYFSDVFSNTIRKVSTDGRMTLLAGNGLAHSSGDGGPAVDAALHFPVGVASVSNGAFVVEAEGHRIRFIDSVGNIHTVVGTGVPGFSGDLAKAAGASCAHPHSIFLSFDDVINPVPLIGDASSPQETTPVRLGMIASSFLEQASASTLAQEKFFFLFTDTENNRVRKVDARGIISTIVGNGREVSSGDGGPATKAGLNRPEDVVMDAEGNVYISEASRVRKVNKKGIISTYAGTGKRGFSGAGGPAIHANLDSPSGLAVDGRDLYVADSWNNIVWRVDEKGVITVFAGTGQKSSTGDLGPATQATLNAPIYLSIQRVGEHANLLISELEGGRVRSITIR